MVISQMLNRKFLKTYNMGDLSINYCITRHGIIKFPKSLASKNQCVIEGHSKYHYTCKLYTDNSELDKRGFIVDHNDIDKAITQSLMRIKFKGSCELMTEKIIEIIVNMLDKKGRYFTKIEITLKGKKKGNPAFITATYEP